MISGEDALMMRCAEDIRQKTIRLEAVAPIDPSPIGATSKQLD